MRLKTFSNWLSKCSFFLQNLIVIINDTVKITFLKNIEVNKLPDNIYIHHSLINIFCFTDY